VEEEGGSLGLKRLGLIQGEGAQASGGASERLGEEGGKGGRACYMGRGEIGSG
jgi:hypothetical protein